MKNRRRGIHMTLKEMKPGQSGQVQSIGESGPLKRRIMDMGITPGVSVKVIKVAPLGDPVEIHVRGYELSLRKEEAARIEVQT
jgi:ferrous iron transport protein A